MFLEDKNFHATPRPETGNEKLLRLADYLDELPSLGFNMARWAHDAACGFSGCAIGWAARGKLFDGLSIDSFGPLYDGHEGHGALRALFEIEGVDSLHLFGTKNADDVPSDVSARIRKFVAGRIATSPYLNKPVRSEAEVRAHQANSLFRAICGSQK